MDMRLCLAFLTIASLGMAIDKRALSQEPPAMKYFDVNRGYSGKWYIMITVNPCSWNGADSFTDWFHEYQVDQTNQQLINGVSKWRDGETCVQVPIRLEMTGPSCLIVRDSIGDVGTGRAVVVATDYTCFLISWGCTKWQTDGKTCADPWIDLKTREPILTPKVRHIAGTIFKKLWGVSIEDLPVTEHTKSCDV